MAPTRTRAAAPVGCRLFGLLHSADREMRDGGLLVVVDVGYICLVSYISNNLRDDNPHKGRMKWRGGEICKSKVRMDDEKAGEDR